MKGTGVSLGLACLVLAGSLGCSTVTSKVTSPEKEIRWRVKADYSVKDLEFRNSMSQLLGAPLVEGNNVVALLNGDQIFPAMLAAIRGAEKSITLESYIWSSGEVSSQFVEALAERARAGVKVHIIADMLGSLKLKKADVDRMTEAGAKFARYNPPIVFNLSLPFKLFRMNHRTHRKLLVVDGRVGFIGGVCLSDSWLGNAEPGHWRDTHFRVEGPVVAQMQGVFAENWLEARSEVLHGRDYFPELKPAGTMAAQCFASGPKDRAEQARLSYLLSMAAAQKNIRLAQAYFVPGKLAIETMLAARRRGVKIEVLVPAKTDLFVVRSASRSRWGELLAAGVEFYEYQPTLYHCKILIVDDTWASVGSVNFDEQSFRHNDESNLNVLDPNFAAELIKIFEDDKSKSRQLTKSDFKRRSWFTKFFDRLFGVFHADL